MHQQLVTAHGNGHSVQELQAPSPQQLPAHHYWQDAAGAQHAACAQGLPALPGAAPQAALQGHAPAAAVPASADGTALTSNLLQAAAASPASNAAAAVSAAAAAIAARARAAASPLAAVASPFLVAAATEASPAGAAGASEAAQADPGAPASPDVAADTCRMHDGGQASVAVNAAALEVDWPRAEEQRQDDQERQEQERQQGQEQEPDCVGVPIRLVSDSDMQSALHVAPQPASTVSCEALPPSLAALRLLSSPKRQPAHQQQPESGVGGTAGEAAGAPSTGLKLCPSGGPAPVLGTSAATVGVPVEVPGPGAAGPAYGRGVGAGAAAGARVEAGAGAGPSSCFSAEGQALDGGGEGPGPQAQVQMPIALVESAARRASAPLVVPGALGKGCPTRTVGPLQLSLLPAGGVPHGEEVRDELYGSVCAALYGTAACGRHGNAVRSFVDALLTACEVSEHVDVQMCATGTWGMCCLFLAWTGKWRPRAIPRHRQRTLCTTVVMALATQAMSRCAGVLGIEASPAPAALDAGAMARHVVGVMRVGCSSAVAYGLRRAGRAECH